MIDAKIAAIDEALRLNFPFCDQNFLRKNSEGFGRRGPSPFRGCCGALDGLAVKIQEPSRNEISNSAAYYNRKGFFALNLQGLCDYEYRFLYVSVTTPGSSHDIMALEMSSLGRLLKRSDGIPEGHWIAGDEAYTCTNRLLTPWPGRGMDASRDCFNYWLSSARIHIEKAFGMLVGRWGILWRPMRLRVAKASQVALVCCKLHNFIIDHNGRGTLPVILSSDTGGEQCEIRMQDD
jgi:DDE superfamily endonuclease